MKTKNLLFALTVLFISTLILQPWLAFAQNPGDLDPTFGTAGKVITNIGNISQTIREVKVLGDGSVVGAGYSNPGAFHQMLVIKYNADGTLDNTFGTSGGYTLTAISGKDDLTFAMDMRPDGKIVAGGYSKINVSNYNFAVLQYLSDGTVDPSFNGGFVVTSITNHQDQIVDLAIQPDGKIIAVGWGDDPWDIVLARYNTDGTLDNSFGASGIVQHDIVGLSDQVYGMKLQDDGKIIICGTTDMGGGNSDSFVARLNTDGSFDNSFGTNGFVFHDFYNHAVDQLMVCDIDTSGNIIAAGYSYSPTCVMTLLKLTPTGSLDLTFNSTGYKSIVMQGTYESPSDIEVLSNGKILITGQSHDGSQTDLFLYRMLSDGSNDVGFGNNSYILMDMKHVTQEPYSFDLSDDESLVTIGGNVISTNTDISLSRFFLEQGNAQPCPPMIEDIEGNRYNTAKRGDQCWMADNMRTTKYPDNSPITKGAAADGAAGWTTDQAWYSCPPNGTNSGEDCAAAATLGMLYQWSAIMQGSTTEGTQGLCSSGWHIPSDSEWKTFEGFLGMTVAQQDLVDVFRGVNEGSKMAAHANDQTWNAGPLTSDPDFGSSGFNLSSAGMRHTNGNYNSRGNSVHLWSSTESGIGARERELSYTLSTVYRAESYDGQYGLSVRCVKDNEPPVIAIEPSNAQICAGEDTSFNIEVTAYGSTTYQWQEHNGSSWINISDGAVYSGTDTTVLTLTGVSVSFDTYLYRCIATNIGGADTSSSAMLTVNSNPTALIGPDPAETCAGISLSLNGGVSGGSGTYTTYDWTGAVAFLSTTIVPNVDFTSGTAGTYNLTYTVTDNVGCSGSDDIVVTVSSNPTASISPDPAQVCSQANLPLSGGASGGSGTYSAHSWSGAAGLSSYNTASTIFNEWGPSSFTLTYTVTDDKGCTGSDNIDVEVFENPTASISPDPAEVCAGETLALSGTANGGSWTYTQHLWTGDVAYLSSTNGSNTDFTAGTAGVYNLTYTVTDNNGCSGFANIMVTVNSTPTASVTPDPAEVCAGETLALLGNNSGGSGTYNIFEWTGDIGNISSTIVPMVDFSSGTTGTYNLTYTVTDNAGCSGSDNIAVTVLENPTATISPVNPIGCSGVALPLSGSASGGSGTYTTHAWMGAAGLSSYTLPNTELTEGSGTYSLTYTVTDDNGCSGSDNMDVNIYSNPTVTVNPDPIALCAGSSFFYSNSVTAGDGTILSHQWTMDTSPLSATNVVNPTFQTETAGVYNLLYTVTDAYNCQASDMSTVTVYEKPTATITPDPAEVCTGVDLNLDGNPVAGDGTISSHDWSGDDTELSALNISNPIFNASTSGIYNLFYNVYDANGCIGMDDITVTVLENPVASITPDPAEVCAGVNLNFSGNATQGDGLITTYNWIAGSGSFSAADIQNPTYSNPVSGSSNILFIVADENSCSDTALTTVTIHDNPIAGISPDPAEVCAGVDLNLQSNPAVGSGIYTSHLWSGDTSPLSSVDVENTTFNSASPGTFNLTYTVIDDNSCTGTDDIVVTVNANDDPDFTYASATYCASGPDALPNYIATPGGFFSEVTGNLIFIDSNTGEIDVDASATETFNILYTTGGICPDTSSVNLTITTSPDAEFSYSAPFCQHGTDPLPSHTTGSDGIYTALPTGLIFVNSNTGEIDLSNSAPGTFIVYNTINVAGCATAVDSQEVVIYMAPQIAIAPDPAETCSGTVLLLDGTATAGDGSITTHSWIGDTYALDNSSIQTPQFMSDTSGTFTFQYIVTDDNSCSATGNISVTVFANPMFSLGVDVFTCDGNTVTIDAGSGYIEYLWNDGSTAQILNVDTTGSYSVTVTDGNGCMANDTVQVTFYTLPAANIVPDGASICESDDTIIDANPTPGDGTIISHLWTGDTGPLSATNVADPIFMSDVYSSYSLIYTVMDEYGCSAQDSIVVTVNQLPVIDLGNDTSVCENQSITIDAGSFTSYLWSSGGTSQTETFDQAGPVSVIVTNAFSCEATDTIGISLLSAPVVNLGDDTVICTGNALTLNAGTHESYLWNDGSTNAILDVDSTTNYFVEVTALNGCVGYDTVFVQVLPSDISLSFDTTSASCSGMSDGSAFVTASGGAGGYNYNWSNGSTLQIASALTNGTYYITVTDANSCFVIDSVIIDVSGSEITLIDNALQATCPNMNDGIAYITADGGTSPYQYLWSTGDTLNSVQDVYPGSYQVTVTDAEGCSVSDLVVVGQEGPEMTGEIEEVQGVICSYSTDGSLLVNASGGTSTVGYSYIWSNGSTSQYVANLTAGNFSVTVTDDIGCKLIDHYTLNVTGAVFGVNIDVISAVSCGDPNSGSLVATVSGGNPTSYSWNSGETTSIINNVSAGVYSVTVTDESGCTGTGNEVLEQSVASFTFYSETTASNCNQSDGTATIAVTSGGTAPYQYSWSNGDNTDVADSLSSGVHMVTVQDANGCKDYTSVVVSDMSGANISVILVQNVVCPGGNSGLIDIDVTNGQPPYTFEWSNGNTNEDAFNLSAATYTVNVLDSNNCLASVSIPVSEPSPIIIVPTIQDATCNEADGAISLQVSGGTAPYTYMWATNDTDSTLSGLMACIYYVTVTDASSCDAQSSFLVNDINGPEVSFGFVTPASCGSGGGSVNINVSGGTAPYSYNWSNGSLEENLLGVPAGNYTVSVTDDNGCVSLADTTVIGQVPPVTQICMVTVDTINGWNLVVWERQDSAAIDYYKIYRETTQSGVYDHIGSVPYSELSVFEDSIANPKTRPWRYKISTIDTCGIESSKSPMHKTLHLQVNQATGGGNNLIWDNYEGFNFLSYTIYRKLPSSGWDSLTTVPNSIHSYSDDQAPGNQNIQYQMAILKEFACAPLDLNKAQGGPYSQSFSNLDDNGFQDACTSSPVSTGDISGPITANVGDSSTYVVEDNTVGSDYTWSLSNGTIISGQGSTQIEVSWTTAGADIVSVTETDSEGCIGDPVNWDVTINTGIDELDLQNMIRIFPNPNNGLFNIVVDKGLKAKLYYEILNLEGQLISSFNDLNTGEEQVLSIDLSILPKGIYMIRIVSDEFVKIEKIIVQ